ncbi:hypothetical protein AL755_03475 (plasmid) [Arthrobacter sp. ERGS1:01]|uniref:hypothetical protein n=1 Tax=Arthrobacter sp. ERGS1:01 TaxID=1704044 RepID=UPI0006B452CB|nr:hypothetical protein [Arthrobacter sp. ERGS1:01]ALE04760.1 hypothetical protein AL755_03475 [Arthrobacter sp. ERGS1:01]
MMLFGLIVGSVITVAGVVGLLVRPNPTLGLLGIIFGLCLLGLGILKARERRQQIAYDKSERAQEDDPHTL